MMITEFLKGDPQMIEAEDCDKVEEIVEFVEYIVHTTTVKDGRKIK